MNTHTPLRRIGFACKWIDRPDQVNGIKSKDDAKQFNTGATTVAWLNRQTKDVAEQKLWDLMVQNTDSTRRLVERVGGLDEQLRMVRLSSDIFLFILSLVGLISGGVLTLLQNWKKDSAQLESWLVHPMFVSVSILVSSAYLLVIIMILSSVL